MRSERRGNGKEDTGVCRIRGDRRRRREERMKEEERRRKKERQIEVGGS